MNNPRTQMKGKYNLHFKNNQNWTQLAGFTEN